MGENGFVNTQRNTTATAVLYSPKAQMDFVKMLGWIEVNVFQDFDGIPELAFLREIRGLDLGRTARKKIHAVLLALQTLIGRNGVN